MPDDLNPYASPAEIGCSLEDPAVAALRRLRAPALGLLILSAMTAAPGIVWLPVLVVLLIGQLIDGRDIISVSPIEIVLGIPLILSNFVILAGTWKMRRGQNYRLAYAAAVLSCIPILSPLAYFGIPLGIWTLVVLHRKDVKAAFAAKAASTPDAR